MEITNKTLAVLLVAAVAVSLFGTIYGLNKLNGYGARSSGTGYATSGAGNATLYLNSTSSIRFAVANIDWGSGSVNSSYTECNLTTESGKSGCVGFNTVSQGLILENDGNTNVSITLQSDVTAQQFIGNSAQFRWKISDNETNSCGSENPTSYAVVNTTQAHTICNALLPNDISDTLKIDLSVLIPLAVQTGGGGQKTATITATAS